MMWLIVCCLLASSMLPARSQPSPIPIATGQGFASYLSSWAGSPAPNTQVLLTTNVSLNGTSYPNADTLQPVSSGSLTITGSNASTVAQPVLVDTAFRTNLLPQIASPAQLTTQQLSFSNLCSEVVVWNSSQNISYIGASNLFLLGTNSTTQQTRQFNNVVLYLSYSEVQMFIYWSIIQQSTFTAVTSLMPSYLPPAVSFQGLVGNVTQYSITYLTHSRPGLVATNLELHAQSDPALGPAARTEPGLFCNGTQLTTTQDTLDNQNCQISCRFPMWTAYNSDSLQNSLSMAGLYTQVKGNTDPLPVILITNNMVVGGDNGQYAAVTLRAECMLHGPLQQGANAQQTVVLKMGTQPNSLQLAVRGRLYIAYLVLAQLYVQQLGSQSPDPAGANYPTALPLWGINMVSRLTTQVYMDKVTLTLPQADYAALLAGAIRGSAWKSGSSSTRPLYNGIDTFQLAPGSSVSPSSTSFLLSNYAGWGVVATNLTITSETPLAANYPLPDLTPTSDGGSGSDKNDSNPVALGLGVGLGGGLLVLCTIAALLLFRHNSRATSAQQAAAAKAGMGNGSDKGTGSNPNSKDLEAGRSHQMMNGNGSVHVSHSTTSSHIRSNGKGTNSEVVAAGNSHVRGLRPSASEPQHLNVMALHAAVRARQANGVNGSPGVSSLTNGQKPPGSGDSSMPDPKKAVQQAVGALGNMDADKLTLLGVLGRGTWGTVYRGQWRNLDVAVKTVLFSNRTDGKGSLPHERAIMEAAVCTSVAHRNVVATYHYDIKPVIAVEEGQGGLQVALSHANMDLLTTEWKLYLVQEWCNTSMGAAMRSGLLHNQATGQPLMDLLLTLLLDTVHGLEYLHDKNIIHGDLKPENVMLKMDSTSPIGVVAKITDFGLSTTLGPQATHVSNFNSGTPFYVAVEVVAEGRVTKASDIYSLGVVMWELYNCSTPWVRDKEGTYNLHPRFNQYPPGTPAAYALLAQQCVQREPRLRPTLREVLTKLQAMHSAWLSGWDSLEVGTGENTGMDRVQVATVLGGGAPIQTNTAPPPPAQANAVGGANDKESSVPKAPSTPPQHSAENRQQQGIAAAVPAQGGAGAAVAANAPVAGQQPVVAAPPPKQPSPGAVPQGWPAPAVPAVFAAAANVHQQPIPGGGRIMPPRSPLGAPMQPMAGGQAIPAAAGAPEIVQQQQVQEQQEETEVAAQIETASGSNQGTSGAGSGNALQARGRAPGAADVHQGIVDAMRRINGTSGPVQIHGHGMGITAAGAAAMQQQQQQ